MNCDEVRIQLVLYGLGELTFEEEELLEQHLSACPECRAERARVERADAILAQHGEAEIPAGLLASCRRELSARIAEEQKSPIRAFSFGKLWRNWVVNPPMWLRPVGAVAMLAIGFAGARLVPSNSFVASTADKVFQEAPPVVSRVRLVSPGESGRVRVLFDETRQKELAGDLSDSRIRNLLLAGATDPTDPGLRLDSIDMLKKQCENDEVRTALLAALRSDPNSGVRLKALEALKPYSKDPETRKVLSQVLMADENPGVRIQVIDLLVQSKEPEIAGVLQEVLRKEQNSYVRSRSQRALSEMKASVGTF